MTVSLVLSQANIPFLIRVTRGSSLFVISYRLRGRNFPTFLDVDIFVNGHFRQRATCNLQQIDRENYASIRGKSDFRA